MAGADVNFTPSDLLNYAESLIRESKLQEARANGSNYSWLKARNLNLTAIEEYFKDLKPILHKAKGYFKISPTYGYNPIKLKVITRQRIYKFYDNFPEMTSESCAAIAVKLDNLSEYATTEQIVATFKKLLEEQYSMQLMTANIKRVKDNKYVKFNKVHPILGAGREPTVSFVLQG